MDTASNPVINSCDSDHVGPAKPGHVPGYVFCVSDLHIGAPVALFHKHDDIRTALDNAAARASHLVLNGDIFDLWHASDQDIDPRPFFPQGKAFGVVPYMYPDVKRLLAAVIIKLQQNHNGPLHERPNLSKAIEGAITQLTQWIEENPDRKVHYILGNHENFTAFRECLNVLAERYPPERFEWHPESIMIGDMLFTHGDLPMRGQTDQDRLNDPETNGVDQFTWNENVNAYIERYGKAATQWRRNKDAGSGLMAKSLSRYATQGQMQADEEIVKKPERLFHVLKDGKEVLLTKELLKDVKHIAFGHTHHPYSNYEFGEKVSAFERLFKKKHVAQKRELFEGTQFHNTGAPTEKFDNEPDKLGCIAAYISEAGVANNVVSYRDYAALEDDAQRLLDETAPALAQQWRHRSNVARKLYPEHQRG